MSSFLVYTARAFVGLVLMTFGSCGAFFGVLSTIHPMPDSSNPDATPPSFLESLGITGAYVLMLVVGIWLVFAPWRKKHLE